MALRERERQLGHLATYLAVAATSVLLACTLVPLAAGDPLDKSCDTSGNYTRNSPYQANVQRLASTLPRKASSSPTLFATSQTGAIPDVVYALALCRGDVNASTCESCVAAAFQDAQNLCAFNQDTTVFYDLCLLRYSNKNFLTFPISDGRGDFMILSSKQNVTSPVRVFDAAIAVLLNATADYAAKANNSMRFGSGVEEFQTFDGQNPRIYGLAQCTPDMAPADCRTCLAGILSTTLSSFSGKTGGRILTLRCNYRYDQDAFFRGSPLLQLPEPAIGALLAPAPAAIVKPPASRGGTTGNKAGKVSAIALPIVALILAIIVLCSCLWTRTKRKPPAKAPFPDTTNLEDIKSIDSLVIDLSTLRIATENFNASNKLGEGGFGVVYKGILPNDQEIAVKRLSESSRQGIEELKNELVLVAKLRHKNLVTLVGVCLENNEKLLVYEHMPNRSLDIILFDPEKCKELDWGKRFKIINGIARGLQYLHEDSQLKIIHRDLKASNVLLDYDYNPKISDFGLARLFGRDQTQDVTKRVVGTYGYMAPEYAMRGYYSIKSDVFSFGVLILEIVTGRRNGGSHSCEETYDHLNLVWEHWTTGTLMEIIDSSLGRLTPRDQMVKCIQIGLLCVQDDPVDRPMMSMVNVMLSRTMITLKTPSKPVDPGADDGLKADPGTGAGLGIDPSAVAPNSDVSSAEPQVALGLGVVKPERGLVHDPGLDVVKPGLLSIVKPAPLGMSGVGVLGAPPKRRCSALRKDSSLGSRPAIEPASSCGTAAHSPVGAFSRWPNGRTTSKQHSSREGRGGWARWCTGSICRRGED
ncbi:hypothetical protein QOZ80_7AG0570380 [Eleusine coracana subsp. coracana]|nr:hypothetical protein QOZ80_7AG0570380 [Eleusine coracana subsp. coracana]